MKLTEFRNGDAIDLFADLLSPISNISADEDFRKMFGKATRFEVAQYLLKNHKDDVLEVLARTNGQTVKEYDANAIEMLKQLLEIFNDKELVQFFQSQGLRGADVPFGSATENTAETETT